MKFQSIKFILILFLVSVGIIPMEAGTERRSFQEEYADPDTGVRFPAVIGEYRKNEVVRNFNPLIGTVIRYADADGGCADIYIYTLDSSGKKISEENFQAHFREIRKAVEDLPKKSSHVSDVQTLGDEVFKRAPGVSGRRVFYRLNIAGGLCNSELTVFPFAGRIVKIRISSSSYYSSGEVNRFSRFLENISNLFNTAGKPEKK